MPRATSTDISLTKSYIPKVSKIPGISPTIAKFYKSIENRNIHEGRDKMPRATSTDISLTKSYIPKVSKIPEQIQRQSSIWYVSERLYLLTSWKHITALVYGISDIVDRVHSSLALKQTRRPQSDSGKLRHSISSSSSHHHSTSFINMMMMMMRSKTSRATHLSSLKSFDLVIGLPKLLSKNDIVIGLPKLKFVKDHLCSSCDAMMLGYTAIAVYNCVFRYTFLKTSRLAKCSLTLAEMVGEEGNTFLYLLKTRAKIRRITDDPREDMDELMKAPDLVLEKSKRGGECEEHALEVHLLEFTVALKESCSYLSPHILCEYLYGLSKKFTNYYSSMREVGSVAESTLLLCEATAIVMDKCFLLLRLTPVSRVGFFSQDFVMRE
ncbi:arginine--tRNA ligase, chloroplastic/mitochondrial [Tanacetum coccineum]